MKVLRELTDRRTVVPVIIVLIIVIVAIVGPFLVHYDPLNTNPVDRLLPPGSKASDGTLQLFGTDQLGRSVAAQVVEGARVSLVVGIAVVILACVVGSAIGIYSGYRRGWLDAFFMRIADIQLAFPTFLLAIFIAALIGPSTQNVILALAVTRWVGFARLARSQTLVVRSSEYVRSTKALGASTWFVIRRCIVPACLSPIIVLATVETGQVIIAEASLSYLGLGSSPQTPSWGLVIAGGGDYLATAWWISAFPGLILAILVVSIGVIGDHFRDRLDPHMRGQISLASSVFRRKKVTL